MTDALQITAAGWHTDLQPRDTRARAPLDPTQVRVALEATGVCFRDLIDRSGRIPFLQVPVVPGHEGVGRVVEVGAGVTDWAVGDRVATMHRDACGSCDACLRGDTSLCGSAAHVFGLTADGTYARQLIAPQSALFAVPDALEAPEAAVLHCTFGTAWRSLVTVGALQPGEKVLVTGANGGVGVAAVQIARRRGAEVVAVVRDARHTALLERLGAHHVVVCTDGRIHDHIEALGCDLALDAVGAPVFKSVLRCLRIGGRAAVVGNVTADRVQLNLGFLIVMGLRVFGAGGATRVDMAAVLAEHATEAFEVPLHAVRPLAEGDAAQRQLRAGGVAGRIVLVP